MISSHFLWLYYTQIEPQTGNISRNYKTKHKITNTAEECKIKSNSACKGEEALKQITNFIDDFEDEMEAFFR